MRVSALFFLAHPFLFSLLAMVAFVSICAFMVTVDCNHRITRNEVIFAAILAIIPGMNLILLAFSIVGMAVTAAFVVTSRLKNPVVFQWRK